MADGSNVIPLVPTSREVAKLASIRPAPVTPHPMSNVGTHGFPAPEAIEPRPRVDLGPGERGWTVWLFGRPYRTGLTETNAARIASALMTLDALDALPGSEPPPPDAA